MRSAHGRSTTRKQIALLSYVNQLIPRGIQVSLVGDGAFESTLLIEYLECWGWTYVLRQSKDNLVMTRDVPQWQRSFALEPGQTHYVAHAVLTQATAYPTHLVLYWKKGETDPWYLATNLPSS